MANLFFWFSLSHLAAVKIWLRLNKSTDHCIERGPTQLLSMTISLRLKLQSLTAVAKLDSEVKHRNEVTFNGLQQSGFGLFCNFAVYQSLWKCFPSPELPGKSPCNSFIAIRANCLDALSRAMSLSACVKQVGIHGFRIPDCMESKRQVLEVYSICFFWTSNILK